MTGWRALSPEEMEAVERTGRGDLEAYLATRVLQNPTRAVCLTVAGGGGLRIETLPVDPEGLGRLRRRARR